MNSFEVYVVLKSEPIAKITTIEYQGSKEELASEIAESMANETKTTMVIGNMAFKIDVVDFVRVEDK